MRPAHLLAPLVGLTVVVSDPGATADAPPSPYDPGVMFIPADAEGEPDDARAGEGTLPPDHPGWPLVLEEDEPRAGLLLVQADLDASLELLVTSGTTSRTIHLLDTDGTYLPGWPLLVPFGASTPFGASLGDIDGDGHGEVVVSCDFWPSGSIGYLLAFETDGTLVPGFPATYDGVTFGSPVVVDLDGDGRAEILLCERNYPTGRLHVFDGTGASLPGWPVAFDIYPGGEPGAVDIDGDGVREIFFESFERLHGLRIDGTSLPGFPFTPPDGHVFSYATPSFGDLDGDGRPEIAVGTHQPSKLGGHGGIWIFDGDGALLPGWPRITNRWIYVTPTFADVDQDGDLEVVAGEITLGSGNSVHVWHADGTYLDGWPLTPTYGVYSQIAVADLDGDGDQELVWGDNTQYADHTGRLFAYHHDGTRVDGYPLHVMGNAYKSSVAIGDVDDDGQVELACVPGDALENVYHIYLWDIPGGGSPDLVEMPMQRYGPGRDGVYVPSPVLQVPDLTSTAPPRIELGANPTRAGVSVSVFLPAPGPATVEILDVQGRLMRTLLDRRTVPAGLTALRWDGRRASGRPASPGAYVVRLVGGDQEETRKLVLLP